MSKQILPKKRGRPCMFTPEQLLEKARKKNQLV